MLDFSWAEFLVVAAVSVFVIGPKELPQIMRGAGRIVRRLQYVRYAFSRQFEDFMREHDLAELQKIAALEDAEGDCGTEREPPPAPHETETQTERKKAP